MYLLVPVEWRFCERLWLVNKWMTLSGSYTPTPMQRRYSMLDFPDTNFCTSNSIPLSQVVLTHWLSSQLGPSQGSHPTSCPSPCPTHP